MRFLRSQEWPGLQVVTKAFKWVRADGQLEGRRYQLTKSGAAGGRGEEKGGSTLPRRMVRF